MGSLWRAWRACQRGGSPLSRSLALPSLGASTREPLQAEAWEAWAHRDFQRALESRLSSLCGDETAEEIAESLDSDQLYSLFESLREEANEYWQSQSSPDQWIDVERIVERASDKSLLSHLSASASEEFSRLLAPLEAV